MKQYHSLAYVLKQISQNPEKYKCVFEGRPKKFKFGAQNYGEIPNLYNRADGDPWDIFAPGYKSNFKLHSFFVIDKVIGVFFLEDGNHKIAVRLKDELLCSQKYENEIIEKYANRYLKYTKKKGVYINF